MSKSIIEVKTSLGLLRAFGVGAGGDYPGIEVWLVKDSGEMGCVSLTEVADLEGAPMEHARLQTHAYEGASEEPTTIECDPMGPWMSEILDGVVHTDLIVLGEDGDRALLLDPGSDEAPFLVVTGFDRTSLSWSRASSYSDIAAASCDFKGYPAPEFSVRGFTPSDVIEAYPEYSISYEQAREICFDLNECLAREADDVLLFAGGGGEEVVASFCDRRGSAAGCLEEDLSESSVLLPTREISGDLVERGR